MKYLFPAEKLPNQALSKPRNCRLSAFPRTGGTKVAKTSKPDIALANQMDAGHEKYGLKTDNVKTRNTAIVLLLPYIYQIRQR